MPLYVEFVDGLGVVVDLRERQLLTEPVALPFVARRVDGLREQERLVQAIQFLSDCPPPCIVGVRRTTSRRGPWSSTTGGDGLSWVSSEVCPGHALGLRPRGTLVRLAITTGGMWPSACSEGVGVPKVRSFAGEYPACPFPCQRFTLALADAGA